MLSINMADVVAVLRSLIPYLVAAGVLLLLAIVITIAVNKKTVQSVGARKMIHAQSWIVALIGIVVAFSMMLTGPMSTLLNNATITKGSARVLAHFGFCFLCALSVRFLYGVVESGHV
ncbi:hypothetical protein, partial [Bifidobacterium subtile]|uniref:hypothetical protein n=1 Tax=Bifidobacterium subtile TaxID=77635 RepID=UPI00046712FA